VGVCERERESAIRLHHVSFGTHLKLAAIFRKRFNIKTW